MAKTFVYDRAMELETVESFYIALILEKRVLDYRIFLL